MSAIPITGGIEESTGRYFRRYEMWHSGGWYYVANKTPILATRGILFAVAPGSIGPLDWPLREPQDAADRLIEWMSS